MSKIVDVIKGSIRSIPDYPKPGILFYDIGTLLADKDAWQMTLSGMAELVEPWKPDVIVGIEARGFVMGAALASSLGVSFAMARKKGKLPGETVSVSYDLEYGQDVIEMQKGVIHAGKRAVVCDDLLATGGTAAAAISLIRLLDVEVVGAVFAIELDFLNGRTRLDVETKSLIHYDE